VLQRSAHYARCVQVVFPVVRSNTDDSNGRPVHSSLLAEGLLRGDLEIPFVILNPRQVKEALIDQVRGLGVLVLDDDRVVVL